MFVGYVRTDSDNCRRECFSASSILGHDLSGLQDGSVGYQVVKFATEEESTDANCFLMAVCIMCKKCRRKRFGMLAKFVGVIPGNVVA